ncbi:cellulose binding iron reductase-like protein [Westerdykella ornata]|uniref:Cellulose binding iron reductase-like protein n=1 Tax=Westerdykella ornata TaxID=318751 RepID=A0A6A6JP49_WESOR|nr:cellulose binding iron reductase-like protein [Westerdykella ornata]KAF2277456.1 cellulose binding iron reductase-like protein [Westerdykella ornata]
MRSLLVVGSALALSGQALAQEGKPVSKVSCDPETKICFSGYKDPESDIYIGIALPKNPVDPYDAVITITSPVKHYWVGFAWGGQMVWNPLTVAWKNDKTTTVSSRFAYGISLPQPYEGAEHFYMKGTKANATHYTITALCKGCTGWQSNEDVRYYLPFNGTTEFAWAYGANGVENPASNTSMFNVHEAYGKWIHDLNAARIDNFDQLVKANLLNVAAPSNTPTPIPTTVVTSIKPSATSIVQRPAAIPSSCSGAGNPAFQSRLANGWKATKIAGGLTNPRSIQFDNAGNMLVVQASKGISYHKVDASGCVTSTKMLVSLNSLNHGIALSADGKTLYASSMTQVYSWPYDDAAGTVGTRSTIITGMYNGGSHVTRTLAMHPTQPLLVVSHGSNSNIDQPTNDPKTGRAIIKVFDLTKIPSGGYNYVSGGWNAGYGQRNDVGITFDNNNHLWGVENSGDQFVRNVNGQSKDIHNNNPGEKIHYMGDVTKPNNNWYGYPTCFTVWQPSDFTDKQFKVGDWFVQAPSSSFNDDTCKERATAPKLTLFPHSAPIDCKFDPDNTNMYITYHGSWNRSPTTGFKLVAVQFKKGDDGNYTPVAPLTSNDAAQDIFYNPDVSKCQGQGPNFSSGCFRPAGLAFDKQGRLFMTSDTTQGELWILGKS